MSTLVLRPSSKLHLVSLVSTPTASWAPTISVQLVSCGWFCFQHQETDWHLLFTCDMALASCDGPVYGIPSTGCCKIAMIGVGAAMIATASPIRKTRTVLILNSSSLPISNTTQIL
eukprot:TRINITY_DN10492_c0_g1_i1.p1 TRINITY_DN10492_c0_g1~~TRINITY_DN10492_c0_g1_i1.p1  ORF type:complete len:116 (-),score=14.17 TRINITY_DN10492_c0_g1_i1:49-396(-)